MHSALHTKTSRIEKNEIELKRTSVEIKNIFNPPTQHIKIQKFIILSYVRFYYLKKFTINGY